MKAILIVYTRILSRTWIYLTVMIIFFAINGCDKVDEEDSEDIVEEFTKIFPSPGDGSYWKIYYSGFLSDTNALRYRIDSIFVSSDTIGLNIIDTSILTPDTTRKIFNILKCYTVQRKNGEVEWTHIGPSNFGLYRMDTAQRRVYSVRTSCNCWPSNPQYPTQFYFCETTVFDYHVESGETVWIEHYYGEYETVAEVQSFYFNDYKFKKQLFLMDGQSFAKRTQMAGVLNTIAFAWVALPDVIRAPNAFLDKMVYYDNAADSLELQPDYRFY